MSVWTPPNPKAAPLNFISTTVELPESVRWQEDRYVDVVPRGCVAAQSGELCVTAEGEPQEGGVSWTTGCSNCEGEICIQHVPEPVRFDAFSISAKLLGCQGSDGPERIQQVADAVMASAPIRLAENFFGYLDGFLDPNLNVTPNGPVCARQALAGVVHGRAAYGLTTGALAMSYGVYLALVGVNLATPSNNGFQVGLTPGTTDEGMPTGGGANLVGTGGGWIAALPSRPAHGVSTRDLHNPQGIADGGELPQRFFDSNLECFCPSSKRWGQTAFDPGCATYADVDLGCGSD